jgi:hypothetical protein
LSRWGGAARGGWAPRDARMCAEPLRPHAAPTPRSREQATSLARFTLRRTGNTRHPPPLQKSTHTHTHAHARTHARTHATRHNALAHAGPVAVPADRRGRRGRGSPPRPAPGGGGGGDSRHAAVCLGGCPPLLFAPCTGVCPVLAPCMWPPHQLLPPPLLSVDALNAQHRAGTT